MMTIRPGSLSGQEDGHVYHGFKKRRAVRFSYIDEQTGEWQKAVVATA
jgi:hypothetical protein